jgi:hypothetical protein
MFANQRGASISDPLTSRISWLTLPDPTTLDAETLALLDKAFDSCGWAYETFEVNLWRSTFYD